MPPEIPGIMPAAPADPTHNIRIGRSYIDRVEKNIAG